MILNDFCLYLVTFHFFEPSQTHETHKSVVSPWVHIFRKNSIAKNGLKMQGFGRRYNEEQRSHPHPPFISSSNIKKNKLNIKVLILIII